MVKCIPDSTKHSSPRISLLVVNYITIQNMLQICWILSELLRWNFAIKNKQTNKQKTIHSIIADLPPLLSLIQFLMVHLHNKIYILFHRKWYESTCLTSYNVSERRKKGTRKRVKSQLLLLKQIMNIQVYCLCG